MTPLQELMDRERSFFFADFNTEVTYSGDPAKTIFAIETDMSDAVSGFIYKTLIIQKSDIGILDTTQTITMRGVKYGIINDQMASDYTGCYEVRLTKK